MWSTILEWCWRQLPDRCENRQGDICPGKGVRGNENWNRGRLLCDDCSAFESRLRATLHQMENKGQLANLTAEILERLQFPERFPEDPFVEKPLQDVKNESDSGSPSKDET